MISKTQEDFWRCFDGLPAEVQQQARERFHLWQKDAFNAALHFKPLLGDVCSVRVNQQYRALARRSPPQGQLGGVVLDRFAWRL